MGRPTATVTRSSVKEPSDEVALACDRVAITKSTLEQRKIERQIEENEDWFRDRERREAETKDAERRRPRPGRQERRQQWLQRWTQYALNSLPWGARQEVEIYEGKKIMTKAEAMAHILRKMKKNNLLNDQENEANKSFETGNATGNNKPDYTGRSKWTEYRARNFDKRQQDKKSQTKS